MDKMNIPTAVQKYLNKFANNNTVLETSSEKYFNNIIVIPAIAEFENIQLLLKSFLSGSSKHFNYTLICFVVNNTAGVSPEIIHANYETLEFLRELIFNRSPDKYNDLKMEINSSGLNIGLVDASSPNNELDEKNGGVGLARKTGMDLALHYFDYNNQYKKLLICLDADCRVDSDYLDVIIEEMNSLNAHAGYVKFEHNWDGYDENAEAIVCYEIFLRYYVLGLMFTNSPYAFHTIGSTMICDHEAYIKVQGMNKRKAAEDFYFMEKLAKHYPIYKIDNTCIYPSGRGSWRVPFGTGQRVNRFISKIQDEYQLYSPKSFELLKKWNDYFFSDSAKTVEEIYIKAEEIHPVLKEFLELNSFEKDWKNIVSNSKSIDQLRQQKKLWFDGFRTLKLIHLFRDKVFENVHMFDALDIILELIGEEKKITRQIKILPDISTQLEYLKLLRQYA